MKKSKELIFVLGMHRSGTSLVAELVHAMGYEVPGDMLEVDDQVNARGFWEPREAVRLNESLLAEAGAAWFDVGLGCSKEILSKNVHAHTKKQIRAYLKKWFSLHDKLVIKDPRLCHLLPIWLSQLESNVAIKVLWVNRAPLAAAHSLMQRDGFSDVTGVLLWLGSFLSGLKSVENFPCFVLDYNGLLESVEASIKLSDFLACAPLQPKQWSSVVDCNLIHHHVEEARSGVLFELADACYKSLGHATEIPPGFFANLIRFQERYQEFYSHSSDLLVGIEASNRALVDARCLAISIGEKHATALEVIADKDVQLADLGKLQEVVEHQNKVIADRETKILSNAAYIKKCEARIHELDDAFSDAERKLSSNGMHLDDCRERIAELELSLLEFNKLRDRLREVESSLRERDADVARNTAYIVACDQHIHELEAALVQFEAVRARLAEVEAILHERNADVARNTAYIATCDQHIRELDLALVQFEAVRVRLAEVEAMLHERDADVARNTAYIATCDQHIRELDVALVQFEAVRARLAEVEATLHERDADVARNTAYIATCDQHIRELDVALVQFEAVRARLAEVEATLHERDADVARNTAYIATCDQHIRELDVALVQFEAVRARLAEVEATLHERDVDVARNAAYIATCDQRIRELDVALVQFEAVRARLAEVETRLHERDVDVEQNTNYIALCELRIREQDALLLNLVAVNEWAENIAKPSLEALKISLSDNAVYIMNADLQVGELEQSLMSVQSANFDLNEKLKIYEDQLKDKVIQLDSVIHELADKDARLQGLLSWRIVRLLERHKK